MNTYYIHTNIQNYTYVIQIKCAYMHALVPSSFETSFGGISVGGSLRGVLDWVHLQEIQPTSCRRDSADRLRRGGGLLGLGWCSPGAPLPSSNLVPSRRWWHAKDRGYFHGKPGRKQQHA